MALIVRSPMNRLGYLSKRTATDCDAGLLQVSLFFLSTPEKGPLVWTRGLPPYVAQSVSSWREPEHPPTVADSKCGWINLN